MTVAASPRKPSRPALADAAPPPPPPIRADLAQARARTRSQARAWLAAIALSCVLAALLLGVSGWRWLFSDMPAIPPEARLWSLNRPPGIAFQDRTGAVIAVRGFHHGAPVRLSELPPYLPRAVLAAEDRRFYSHPGVDLRGLARALWRDLREGRRAEGGSTLTQQLARNLFLGPEQTVRRKAQEAVLALELERRIPKDRLLELYLDRTYFGGGAYGIDAAARLYFGRPARELDLAQAVLLAALPEAPSRMSPGNDLAAAHARAARVLAAMRAEGWIGPQAQADALAHPAEPVAAAAAGEGGFGPLLDLAAAEARSHAPGRPDLVVRLTVDPRLQRLAAEAVRSGVAEAAGAGATQGALAALAPDGAVVALQGGVDSRAGAYDRAVQALRQPGSAFKPLVYAAALAQGVKPDDVRQDAPVDVAGWRPQNFGGGYAGAVTVADALARSINTVAVRLTLEVGPERVARLARSFGITTLPARPGPSIALGAYEVRLLELVGAYGVIQNGGLRRPPYLVESVSDARGALLWRRAPLGWRVYEPADAAALTRMMQGVVERGTGRAAALGRPAAGKTGTTQNHRDAWFVGFTPDYVAGVWLGDDRGRPMAGVTGGEAPARAWSRFMRAAEDGLPVRDFAEAPAATDKRAAFYETLAREMEDGDLSSPARVR